MALEISDLAVAYTQRDGSLSKVVSDVDLTLHRGKVLGVAGESGCGKSTMALAAIGYRPGAMRILGGTSRLSDVDLLGLPLAKLRQVWGSRVVYVPQASSLTLTPALTIGTQMAEPMKLHLGLRGQELRARQVELLTEVGVPNPEAALQRYPHQFSGGQQQRINLAIALSCNPEVLILDEPTTGLDVTTQARIMSLLQRVVAQHQTAAMLVSHDLPLLAEVCDQVAIMYGGQVVEAGPVETLLSRPAHPYTKALLAAVPDPSGKRALSAIPGAPPHSVVEDACPFAPRCLHAIEQCVQGNPRLEVFEGSQSVRCVRAGEQVALTIDDRPLQLPEVRSGSSLLRVGDLWCEYRSRRQGTPVVKGVSFDVAQAETLAIVGESGSGKSTLIRAIAGLHPLSSGSVRFEGVELAPDAGKRPRSIRRDMQIVFQNPDMSLNPRHDVMSLIARPMQLFEGELSRRDREERVRELLSQVNLLQSMAHRYPAELSGGQKQRVAIARAFAANPKLILADEITSALDVSVQAAILSLLSSLSAERGTSVVFVSHDLAVVRAVAHRALVLQEGVVREVGPVDRLFESPEHEYTRELVNAIPTFGADAGGFQAPVASA
ncbi:dipeptide ABC transporter ATP-binding protein [Nocardioides pocheonensis]|uniref:dipeptide ABC transporter ATP-binding protein n=1 Tax=Nocardioides pocheonensis TaxID=661485 RepID=UPI0016171EF5|nr:ABC transporter ATP-binding protein [Nocardioides pocheonensis]